MQYPITKKDILVADSILRKVFKDKVLRGAEREEEGNILLVSNFSYFNNLRGGKLNKREFELLRRLCAIKPQSFGVNMKRVGIHPAPKNVVQLPPVRYLYKGEKRVIWTQYVARNVFCAFQKMNLAMQKEIGRRLFIKSGYRSPAYQAVVFLRHWQLGGYSFIRTLRLVALPGYSEHGDPVFGAIDIMTQEGIPDDLDKYSDMVKMLVQTLEYKWLSLRAHEFGFCLSYERKNKDKIVFEPWHWRFAKKKIKK